MKGNGDAAYKSYKSGCCCIKIYTMENSKKWKPGRGPSQNRPGIDATELDEPIPAHFLATRDLGEPPWLQIFITMPIVSFSTVFTLYQSVSGVYYFRFD